MHLQNMKKSIISCLLFLTCFSINIYAQPLVAGFSKTEYITMLQLAYRQVQPESEIAKATAPGGYKLLYRSPEMGLDNRWDLWVNDNNTAVISIRGTTREMVSWLANFYAAMVPATGHLQLEENYRFDYHLADDTKAAVHIGWLISTGMLVRDILPRLDSLYKSGSRQFFITGHSQGGGITYLLTAHLRSLQKSGRLPSDIRFKTYASAAPKPGNLYFAYAYEAETAGGWAFNVVNASDWVPETPVSIQTIDDFNKVNPFTDARAAIKKHKFPACLILKRAYRKLSKPPAKARNNYQKYLGNMVSKLVKQHLPGFEAPPYFNSSNYCRTGQTIVLLPDEHYRELFPDSKEKIFIHHLFDPYFYLAGKLPND